MKIKATFILTLIFMITLAAGRAFGAYSGGTGDPNTPYQIATKADLLALRDNTGDYGKCFILTVDIDLGGQVFTTAIIAPDTNSSSGFQGTAFTGTFDGNGHKITNFTINGGSTYLGLFGQINSVGSVKNLGLENFSVSGDSNSQNLGSLVGYNSGSIRNCYSTGQVSGDFNSQNLGGLVGYNNYGSVSDCCSMSSVIGSSGSQNVGGLVGNNNYAGRISNCYSMGQVSGSSYVGGLVGVNYESINNCYSISQVSGDSNYVGGFAGYNGGNISNCYSMGQVSGFSCVGGLVGGNNFGSISNCYSTGAVSGSSSVGGLVGYGGWLSSINSINSSFWDINTSGLTISSGGTGKTTAEMKMLITYTSDGWDFINETINGTCNYWQMSPDDYPVLSTFNGYIPPEPNGNGTPQNPYIIADANDLGTIWYRPNVNYVLANDINLAGIDWSMAVVPIFSGVLDGNGFCIENLSIRGAGFLGLFSSIERGSVKNLGIKNCIVISEPNSQNVGGLVGYNGYGGIIINCYSTGNVSGSSCVGGFAGYNAGTISNCYSTGQVSGSYGSQNVGGLVGYNSNGGIINCYSTGNVSGSTYIGGLVGETYGMSGGGSIINCYSTGNVSGSTYIGGLVGETYGVNGGGGSIINCYSIGNVSGSTYIGGLVGKTYGVYGGGSIINCYSTGNVSGSTYIGGLVGNNGGSVISSFWDKQTSGQTIGVGIGSSAGVSGKTTAEMKTKSTFTDAMWNFFAIWDIVEGQTYPFFKSGGGAGTSDNPYKIATKEDLLVMAADKSYYSKCFILMSDIDMGGQVFTTAIVAAGAGTSFTGTFDGNDHKITNFTINGVNYLGLFGNIGSGGSVKNLGLESYSISGSNNVGGLVGYNYGTISNCYSTGAVNSGSNSYYVGGLVGRNSSNISNCYSTGAVSSGTGSYYVGGLVGINSSSISNCYSTGAVSSGTGSYYVGGLLGYNNGTVTTCFWDKQTSGQTIGVGIGSSAGVSGKTTAEMQTKSTFTNAGWNFSFIWDIVEGQTYPFFKIGVGSGIPDDPYQINTKEDLLEMAADKSYYDKCFILMADINMGGRVFATAIITAGDFTGTFDGNDHKISNFTINGENGLGLFCQISSSGLVKNLGLENCSVSGSNSCIGCMVGVNLGTISSCYSTGTVTGIYGVGGLVGWNYGTMGKCYSTCTVTGGDYSYYLGGLIGGNYGKVNNCYSTGAVTGGDGSCHFGGLTGGNYTYAGGNGSINNCYSTGDVRGSSDSQEVGGLVGENYSSIKNCYSIGTITGSFNAYNFGGFVGYNDHDGNISNCYSMCNVSGNSDSDGVGGLAGENGGSISNCYSRGSVSCPYDVGGLVGYNDHDGSIINCYSTDAVSGDAGVGGLVGWNDGGSVSGSFWNIQTSGQMTSAGGTGLSTPQMKQQASFTGWDFTTIWAICEGTNYPRLVWQIPAADWVCPDGVNFADFAYFAERWQTTGCDSSNNFCGGTDMDSSGTVDMQDFAILAENWLSGQ